MTPWRDRVITALAVVILGTTLVSAQPFSRPGGPGLTVVAGGGGSGTVAVAGGSGTTNRLMKFNASDNAADSLLSDDGTNVLLTSGLFILGTADTSGVALKLSAGILEVREGDDSTYAAIRSIQFQVAADQVYRWVGSTLLYSPSDGDLRLTNNAESVSTRLSIGSASGTLGVGDNANGKFVNIKSLTELTTIAAAATTDTTIQIPANSLVIAVTVRVTTVIPTATTFDIGVAGATTRYGTGVSTAANTTNSSPGTTNPTIYSAAIGIRFTPNLTPLADSGRVRTTIYFIDATAPTS